MIFAKLIDNQLQIAPNPLVVDDKIIANPTADILLQQGYLPVVIETSPDINDYYYTPIYTKSNNKIYQSWEEHKIDNNLEDDKLTKLEEQITDVQEALCELYESIV